jgi:hypothetical protein
MEFVGSVVHEGNVANDDAARAVGCGVVFEATP